jgi:hypothetical protein
MNTSILAASGLMGMGEELYWLIAGLGGFGALAAGIIISLRTSFKMGFGSGIAAFFMGVILSVCILNAVGFRDIGVQELHEKTGYTPGIYSGQ